MRKRKYRERCSASPHSLVTFGAVLCARVGSQYMSVCHGRICQVALTARGQHRLTVVSSHGQRKNTADAMNQGDNHER